MRALAARASATVCGASGSIGLGEVAFIGPGYLPPGVPGREGDSQAPYELAKGDLRELDGRDPAPSVGLRGLAEAAGSTPSSSRRET